MARYLLTSIPPRTELIPAHNTAECGAVEALLDESERRRLQSYRPPSGLEIAADPTATVAVGNEAPDSKQPTGRWTAEERDALLALARTAIETDESSVSAPKNTIPPRRETRRVTIRRAPGEISMSDVRQRLRGAG